MNSLPTVARPHCQSVTSIPQPSRQSVNICLGCHCRRLNCHLAIVFVCWPSRWVMLPVIDTNAGTGRKSPPLPIKPTNCGQMSGGGHIPAKEAGPNNCGFFGQFVCGQIVRGKGEQPFNDKHESTWIYGFP